MSDFCLTVRWLDFADLGQEGFISLNQQLSAPVFMAAIMKYMCAEVLELATTKCMQSKRKRLTPRHIELGIRSDPELARYFKDKTFFNGGMVPKGIDPRLAMKKKGGKKNTQSESQAV